MSLFNTCNYWSTKCDTNTTEPFTHRSLAISNFNSEFDTIIIGNHEGYLWAFRPKSERVEEKIPTGFTPTDQLIEIQLPQPILQVRIGKFVSGSMNNFIGVLHPRKFAVHNLVSRKGLTAHGDQTQLPMVYEHRLQRSTVNFEIGQFGGISNRDFICIQSLDGMLSFFEQEVFSFCCFLPEFLLPGPLTFVPRTDLFVTIAGDWNIHAYKYQSLSEAGVLSNETQTSGKRIEPDWSYPISEGAIEIVSLRNNSFESYIVILGEHNLYCINDQGKLKFIKRFEFTPMCFHPYLLEPENKLMILIVSDTKTLMIYENTILRWSAQLEFSPLALSLGNYPGLRGGVTILSNEGDIECCYLGTTPSQYIIPPIVNKDLDFKEAESELQRLQKVIDAQRDSNVVAMSSAAAERELVVNISVNPHLLPCAYPNNIITETQLNMCELIVDLNPHAPFDEVQIILSVDSPLVPEPKMHFLHKLHSRQQCTSHIFQKDPFNIVSLDVFIIISCITNSGMPRVLRKKCQVPLKLVATVCAPIKESIHKITINTSEAAVPLAQLFPEFAGESALSLSSNAIGFVTLVNNESIVTILAAKSSQRYRIQADSIIILYYLIQELLHRLEKHFAKKSDFKTSFSSPLQTQSLLDVIDSHFESRKIMLQRQKECVQYAAQFRVIQKRLMSKFKEKNPAILSNLKMLLQDTHQRIAHSICDLENSHIDLLLNKCRLCGTLQLMLLLVKLSGVSEKSLTELQSALHFNVIENDEQGWEEVVETSLNQLLRTTFAKYDKDKLRANTDTIQLLNDTVKLKKHLTAVLDRIIKPVQHFEEIPETVEQVITTNETKATVVPVGSRLGELRSERPPSGRARAPILLQARKTKQDETF